MTQQYFTPTADLRQRGSCTLLIALAACFLPRLPSPAFPRKPGGQPAGQPRNTAPAQTNQNGAPTDVGTPTIITHVNEVSLIFTVNDKHGHYIPNLNQSDFALLDDQQGAGEGQLVPSADQSAAARGHPHRHQQLHPFPFPI
jgi:hypothetical protein